VPTVDLGFRLAYRVAYQLMRLYWFVARPNTHGALIAIWHEGELLLVKNSYVSYYCLPGGYLKRGETAKSAAVRELAEECAIRVRPDELHLGRCETHQFEGKTDTVEIFDLEVAVRPPFRVDGREVVAAAFHRPETALKLELFPPLQRHIEGWLAAHEA
jgi:8-oxo-dGTP diphosphatase